MFATTLRIITGLREVSQRMIRKMWSTLVRWSRTLRSPANPEMTSERDGVPLTLSIGVLIIGSLYWDPRRQGWRDSRLDVDNVFNVHAPIRYGRRSTGRGHTYTMVL